MTQPMSLDEALGLLGLTRASSADAALSAYRAHAWFLHPDRVSGMTQDEADHLQAELDEAWFVVEAHLHARAAQVAPPPRPATPTQPAPPATPPPAPPPDQAVPPHPIGSSPEAYAAAVALAASTARRRPPRFFHDRLQSPTAPPAPVPQSDVPLAPRTPTAKECASCGWWPAGVVVLHWYEGLIVGGLIATVRVIQCRACSDATYADAQAYNLKRGWWSLVGMIATPVFFMFNVWMIRTHHHYIKAPVYRAPDIATPALWPARAFPWWRRPGPALAGAVASLAMLLIAVRVAADLIA